ncbi:hypothetical protein RvY_15042 [Ramazzottius varieornatus]|uniref:Uncharacterized protein n=1 Tax=Ramazzottius varieornatus TaxID=947166 RepID=A0A1D1VUW4_RAMVA|nr:hypothetical protein RvY_15042 [Ramazzottius varieornatus]
MPKVSGTHRSRDRHVGTRDYPTITRFPPKPVETARIRTADPATQPNPTLRSTDQKIHSYTNSHNQHLQEKIPPNKWTIGLRPAYRPGYAICVIIGGCINLASGIIMTAIAYSHADVDIDAIKVLKVLGPVVLVIGIIFLLCGAVLLWHYRKTRREDKIARERGHGYYDRPARSEEDPRSERRKHRHRKDIQSPYKAHDHRALPLQTVQVAPTTAQSEYSVYDELPRYSKKSRTERELARGDWKYVSEIKDATLTPKYPREIRKSIAPPDTDARFFEASEQRPAPAPAEPPTSTRYRMYPYDKSFGRTPYDSTGRPPKTNRSQRRREERPPQRY